MQAIRHPCVRRSPRRSRQPNGTKEVPMTLGPLEYTVIGFEGNRFDGSIADELQRVVESGIIAPRRRRVHHQGRRRRTSTVARARQQGRPSLRRLRPAARGHERPASPPEDIDHLASSLPVEHLGPGPCSSSTAGRCTSSEAHHRRRRLPRQPGDHRARGPRDAQRRARGEPPAIATPHERKERTDMMRRRRGPAPGDGGRGGRRARGPPRAPRRARRSRRTRRPPLSRTRAERADRGAPGAAGRSAQQRRQRPQRPRSTRPAPSSRTWPTSTRRAS